MKKTVVLSIILLFMIGIGFLFKYNFSNNSTEPQKSPSDSEDNPPIVVSPPEKDNDQLLLESLSLDEKIGQLLMIGYKEAQPVEKVREFVQEYKVGGFILFNRNYSNLEDMVQTTNQLNAWNSSNPLPLFLSLDEEGGTVSRIPKEGTKLPDARLLGAINDTELTFRAGAVIGEELKAMGINMDYAPVLDIVSSPDNRLLFKRSFGSTPEIVSKHGVEFIKGLYDQGVIAVPKHFPGHGDTIVDSHGKLPKIMIDKEKLLSRELVPFKAAIDAGIDALMVGHLSFPLIDATELPATKSEIFLGNILRDDLGYKGLIITDDIEMLGYLKNKADLPEEIIRSLQAGVDIFLIGHTGEIQMDVFSTIKTAVQNNIIPESRIDESVLRIIKVKTKYLLSENTSIDLEQTKLIVGSAEHKEVLKEITDRAK